MKRHLGSTIALCFGILSFLTSVTPGSNHRMVIMGVIIILGALAYRSAKKRKIGEVKSSIIMKSMELVAMGIITSLFIFFMIRIPESLIENPVFLLIAPLWTIIVYIVVIRSKNKWQIFADREEKVKGDGG